MAYFEDLSPYTYGPEERGDTVNVGWLEKGHPYVTGETSQEFRDKLALLCGQAGRRRRGTELIHVITCGIHRCEFCSPGGSPPGSSTEIRVRRGNRVYAAPQLLHHYVIAHGYQPPSEFIAAVLDWDGEIFEEGSE